MLENVVHINCRRNTKNIRISVLRKTISQKTITERNLPREDT